jgi:hypothetical protein
MTDQHADQRRYLRFPPDEWEIGLIQCSDAPTDEANFKPVIAGLVMEESRAGCGLVVLDRQIADRLAEGDRCLVKVAKLGIVLAEVRWLQPMDGGISRMGLNYIE